MSDHRSPVGGHILVVFVDGAGEPVVARGVGDEVIVVRLCRMHRCFQRALARIGDRAGGKPHKFVSVVVGVETHVVVMQRPTVSSG